MHTLCTFCQQVPSKVPLNPLQTPLKVPPNGLYIFYAFAFWVLCAVGGTLGGFSGQRREVRLAVGETLGGLTHSFAKPALPPPHARIPVGATLRRPPRLSVVLRSNYGKRAFTHVASPLRLGSLRSLLVVMFRPATVVGHAVALLKVSVGGLAFAQNFGGLPVVAS